MILFVDVCIVPGSEFSFKLQIWSILLQLFVSDSNFFSTPIFKILVRRRQQFYSYFQNPSNKFLKVE